MSGSRHRNARQHEEGARVLSRCELERAARRPPHLHLVRLCDCCRHAWVRGEAHRWVCVAQELEGGAVRDRHVCSPQCWRALVGAGRVRPATRADCAHVPRPCPYVSCRYHLFLDVDRRTGAVKLNFPDLEPSDLSASCVLDVCDAGAKQVEQIAVLLNLSRERARLVYRAAAHKVRASADLHEFCEDEGDDP